MQEKLIKIPVFCFILHVFLFYSYDGKSEFSAAITLVFSVTLYLRNHLVFKKRFSILSMCPLKKKPNVQTQIPYSQRKGVGVDGKHSMPCHFFF